VRRSTGHSWCSDLGKAAFVCTVIAGLIAAGGVRAAEEVATNLDIMQRLTAQVVTELHGKFNASLNGRTVQLKPAGGSEDYVFVMNVFREELIRLGVDVVEPANALTINSYTPPRPGSAAAAAAAAAAAQATTQPTGGSGATPTAPAESSVSAPTTTPNIGGPVPLQLRFQNVVFALDYTDSHRAFLFGGKRVDRRAAVRVMATLSDETGKVLWVGEAASQHSDEYDYAQAAVVEQGTYQFNQPVVPAGGWGRYAEPVFVTGIIVGLIYLFFSNQSDN